MQLRTSGYFSCTYSLGISVKAAFASTTHMITDFTANGMRQRTDPDIKGVMICSADAIPVDHAVNVSRNITPAADLHSIPTKFVMQFPAHSRIVEPSITGNDTGLIIHLIIALISP